MNPGKSEKIDILLFVPEKYSENDLVFQGEPVPEILAKRFSQTGHFNKIYCTVLESSGYKFGDSDSTIIRPGSDDVDFWKRFFTGKKPRHAVRILADSPFIDPDVVIEMIDVHRKNFAEYTYSENLPPGLAAEIISSELIDSLPDVKEKTLSLPEVVKANINHFDVEIFYKDPDIRDKRISFLSSNLRDRKIMENIFQKQNSAFPVYESLKEIIESDPGLLYTGPSYIEVEPSGRCSLDCVFCYRGKLEKERGDISAETYNKILTDMSEFELPYSICFGGSGEPLMHSSIYDMIQKAVAEPLVENLVIETNGIEAGESFRQLLESSSGVSKIKVIVNINGYDRESYSALHGSDMFDRVFENVKELAKFNEPDNRRVYIQLMKINETKDFTDSYYDFWDGHGLPVIFQKHNSYLTLIEDRSYSDLSPVERIPCWHLQRDLFISSDGITAFCKQDVNLKNPPGSVSEKSIRDIFESGRERFLRDYRGELHKSPDCSACDEWYTFNL